MWHLHFPFLHVNCFFGSRAFTFCFAIWEDLDVLDVHFRTDFCDFLNQLIFMVAVLELFDCNSCIISHAWMSYMRSLIILQKTKKKTKKTKPKLMSVQFIQDEAFWLVFSRTRLPAAEYQRFDCSVTEDLILAWCTLPILVTFVIFMQ